VISLHECLGPISDLSYVTVYRDKNGFYNGALLILIPSISL